VDVKGNNTCMEEATWPPEDRILHRWVHEGIECAVLQGPMAFCGYAKVPVNHLLHGMGYDEATEAEDVYAHGGLTFSRTTEDGTWFGFDCAHAGDALGQPLDVEEMKSAWGRLSSPFVRDRAWTFMDVVEETCFLAHQLAAIGDGKCRRKRTE